MNKKSLSGFTLIELLVVIGILSILLAITLIAINPARQFSQTNDLKRKNDVAAILSAINQYMVDNKGQLPSGINTQVKTISNDAEVSPSVDLCSVLIPRYIAALPVDPTTNNGQSVTNCSDTYDTNYRVSRGASDNRITVSASGEIDSNISVTR